MIDELHWQRANEVHNFCLVADQLVQERRNCRVHRGDRINTSDKVSVHGTFGIVTLNQASYPRCKVALTGNQVCQDLLGTPLTVFWTLAGILIGYTIEAPSKLGLLACVVVSDNLGEFLERWGDLRKRPWRQFNHGCFSFIAAIKDEFDSVTCAMPLQDMQEMRIVR